MDEAADVAAAPIEVEHQITDALAGTVVGVAPAAAGFMLENEHLRTALAAVQAHVEARAASSEATQRTILSAHVELLQDLVLAATNEALRSAQELAATKMGGLTGGLDLGSMGLPGLGGPGGGMGGLPR